MSLTATPDGVLLVDKAAGMTSHDVVAIVSQHIHATPVPPSSHRDDIPPALDALIQALLAKAADERPPTARAVADALAALRAATDSQDRTGMTLQERPLPALDEATVRSAFDKYAGDFYQMPPMVSAIKQGGVPLYKLARQGKVVERDPRLVHVYRYSIDRIAPPEIDFTVLCSKGFYVRTYAHDIGETLGCGAHLKSLRRTKSGRFRVEGAVTVEALKASPPEEIVGRILSLPEVSRMRGA